MLLRCFPNRQDAGFALRSQCKLGSDPDGSVCQERDQLGYVHRRKSPREFAHGPVVVTHSMRAEMPALKDYPANLRV